MIEGVKITKLKQIEDKRGKIMHMLRNDSPIFDKFGEIYFSTVKHDFIKAWHLHKEATLNYACVKGRVNLVLYDDRKDSKSFNCYESLILSPEDYFLVTIPPYIWNGFKGLDKTVPSGIPNFFVNEPVATFLTINSTGIISTK